MASLKETANPHYILREFLLHNSDEVYTSLQSRVTRIHAAHVCRREMEDTSGSFTSKHGQIMECHMNLEWLLDFCRYVLHNYVCMCHW